MIRGRSDAPAEGIIHTLKSFENRKIGRERAGQPMIRDGNTKRDVLSGWEGSTVMTEGASHLSRSSET